MRFDEQMGPRPGKGLCTSFNAHSLGSGEPPKKRCKKNEGDFQICMFRRSFHAGVFEGKEL